MIYCIGARRQRLLKTAGGRGDGDSWAERGRISRSRPKFADELWASSPSRRSSEWTSDCSVDVQCARCTRPSVIHAHATAIVGCEGRDVRRPGRDGVRSDRSSSQELPICGTNAQPLGRQVPVAKRSAPSASAPELLPTFGHGPISQRVAWNRTRAAGYPPAP